MAPILKFGASSTIPLDRFESGCLGYCGMPPIDPIDDVSTAVVEALDQPLEYPPLADMVVPGDRVVVALADEVPCSAEIVAGMVRSLLRCGVDPDGIRIVHTRAVDSLPVDLGRLLDEDVRKRISLVQHDPGCHEGLAYLATTDEHRPVELCRELTDADLVLPIGSFRNGSWSGYYGVSSPIYPTFSSEATLTRFHSPKTLDARGRHRKRLVREADEVGWLLGVNFTIQVVPGPGDRVLGVMAGEIGTVGRAAQRAYAAAWRSTVPRRADLVVATIEGGEPRQTWQNLGRVLAAAVKLVRPGGAIAVCCDLAADPGAAIDVLGAERLRDEAVTRIQQEELPDAATALQLAAALDHCSIYLLSRLSDTVVEDLEITPIGGPDEVLRLISRHGSYIVLANAALATVAVEDEAH